MVNTRSSSSRAASLAPDVATPPNPSSAPAPASPSPSPRPVASRRPGRPRRGTMAASRSPSSRAPGGWAHTPTPATLFWMAVSLPLVVWDTAFVLGRPHTMEGGRFHWPLWVPYKLYGQVDHVYGWKALEARNGFTAAQGLLNLVETAMYLAYLCVYLRSSRADPGTRPAAAASPRTRAIRGRAGAVALLVGFSAAVMTLSKTVLYWMNEYYSGFDNIGHNAMMQLLCLWIIPNGAWLVGSAYMICSLGGDIIQGLEMASARVKGE